MTVAALVDEVRAMTRAEIVMTLERATAHAAAAGSHALAGSDRAMTVQVRCAAACIVAAAELCASLSREGRGR